MRRLGLTLCLALGLSACGHGYRKVGWMNSGYSETQIDFAHWVVSYHGGNLEFCKRAALYRSAELCKEKGFGYFRLKDGQILGTFVPRRPASGPDMVSQGQGNYLTDNTSGLVRKADVAGYCYRAEFFKDDPKTGDALEAEAVLRHPPLPATGQPKDDLEHYDAK